MLSSATFGVVLLLGLVAMVLERTGAPVVPDASRRSRALAIAIVGSVLLIAFSPHLLWLKDQPLPVERPAEPWHTDQGCSDHTDIQTSGWIFLILIYLLARGGLPALVALFWSRPGWNEPRVADGRRAFRLGTWSFAIVAVIATVRVLIGGAAPASFSTYGAVTPEGAGGWRADAWLATVGDRRAIPEAEPIHDDVASFEWAGPSDDCCGAWVSPPSRTTMREGLQAWVGDAPVLFYSTGGGDVVGAKILARDPRTVPPERRPHFADWPRVARLDDEHLAIVGHDAHGGLLAIKVEGLLLAASAATEGDAWPFIAPPLAPWIVALWLGGLGFVLPRRWPRLRLLGAWLLLEGTAALVYAYARFVI